MQLQLPNEELSELGKNLSKCSPYTTASKDVVCGYTDTSILLNL